LCVNCRPIVVVEEEEEEEEEQEDLTTDLVSVRF
jgi:hypothetical protein